jgi:hypothetical protein
MLAYHSDPELKTFVLNQIIAHREADKLVKGRYWHDGKGCAVGCTLEAVRLHNGNATKKINHESHSLYETELGIPRILARLEDRFFESLPNTESQAWPERFTSAIRPGADLAMVWPRFAFWLLTEECPQHTKNTRSLASLAEVGALYREWLEAGAKPSTSRWLSARRNAAPAAGAADDAYADAAAAAAAAGATAAAAAAAAAAGATAAAYADAYAAAYAAGATAAAYADAYAAAYAAGATAAAYADADAYAAAAAAGAAAAALIACYRRQSDKLIELLRAA